MIPFPFNSSEVERKKSRTELKIGIVHLNHPEFPCHDSSDFAESDAIE